MHITAKGQITGSTPTSCSDTLLPFFNFFTPYHMFVSGSAPSAFHAQSLHRSSANPERRKWEWDWKRKPLLCLSLSRSLSPPLSLSVPLSDSVREKVGGGFDRSQRCITLWLGSYQGVTCVMHVHTRENLRSILEFTRIFLRWNPVKGTLRITQLTLCVMTHIRAQRYHYFPQVIILCNIISSYMIKSDSDVFHLKTHLITKVFDQ